MINNRLPKDCEIMYICKFGSHLYGLNNENSDIDYKIIFKPPFEKQVFGVAPKRISFSTGKKDISNTNKDVDIEFINIYEFLKSIAEKGDINCIDILFSPSNKDCVVYDKGFIKRIYNNRDKFFNKNILSKGTFGYSYSQFKRYHISGTGYNAYEFVLEKIKKLIEDGEIKLKVDFIKEIQNAYEDHLIDKGFIKDEKNRDNKDRVIYYKRRDKEFLQINRSMLFGINTPLKDIVRTIEHKLKHYGERGRKLIDFKALSHSYRALLQIDQYAKTGDIKFPFKDKDKKIC